MELGSINSESEKKEDNLLFFWSAMGSVFLNAALASILVKTNEDLWPLVVMTFVGFIFTWRLQWTGLIFSAVFMGLSFAWKFPLLTDPVWTSAFLASTLMSWVITLLGCKQVAEWVCNQKKEIENLKEVLAQENLPLEPELEVPDVSAELRHSRLEIEKWQQLCEELTEQMTSYQRKENSFQIALENAQSELLKLKHMEKTSPANPVISQENAEEKEDDKPKEFFELEILYRQLRGQFEEKSEILAEARKELFQRETELLAFRKEKEEQELLVTSQDIALENQLRQLELERTELLAQVQELEKIVSTLLTQKKPTAKRKTRAKKSLPVILQDAIDQKQTDQQFSLLE